VTVLGKDPDTRPLFQVDLGLFFSPFNIQGLNLAGLDAAAAKGTAVGNDSAAVNHGDGAKGTVLLADAAADTLFTVYNQHHLLSVSIQYRNCSAAR